MTDAPAPTRNVAARPATNTNGKALSADPAEIGRALHVLFEPGQVVELRALDVADGRWSNTVFGYFDDFAALAQAAARLSPHAMGVYATLNRTDPRIIARKCNKAEVAGKGDTLTGDSDILGRRWLMIDADPPRPAGISASDAEHDAALAVAAQIRADLVAAGWPAPLDGDSGNGGHELWRIDLPAEDGGLIERVLKALAFRYDTNVVKIDTSVHNPARISKLYGTIAGKGDSTDDRPHRLARLLHVPDHLEVVTREQLGAVAAWLPKSPDPEPHRANRSNGAKFDIEQWIADQGLDVASSREWNGGRKWVLGTCPWNSSHTDRSAYIVEWPGGKLGAGCHHNGCQDKNWAALRELFEPGYAAKKATYSAGHSPNGHHPPMPEPPPDNFSDAAVQPLAAQAEQQPKPTDDELAAEWRDFHPQTIFAGNSYRRYDPLLGTWPEVPADAIRAEIMAILENAKPDGIRPSARLLASVMELARISIVIPQQRLDARIELIPCANGCYNRNTGKVEPHAPEHYFTSSLPFDYDPDAKAGVWDYFLLATLPDAYNFAQEFAGYCLTVETGHETALWLYGPAGSGKSTFLLGLQSMLGSRAGLLSLADVQRSRFALASLPGKTLVVSTEQPASYVESTYILNALISGEPVQVEQKFKDAITVTSRAKVAWAMNSLPRVGEAASGLFRRVKVVKFPELPEAKRDPALKEAIAKEGAGILNWALRGLERLTANRRFSIPAGVVDATEEFRQANDIPAAFVAECCVLGADYKVKTGQLYKAYKDWAIETGHKPQSMTSIAADWDRLGFDKYNASGNVWRRGVGIKSE